MGPRTAAALRAYQRDHGLSATGQLDSQTASALSETANATVMTPAVAVRTAQRQLKERGYYTGPVDGVIGPATENALRAYQRDRGLKVTGRLDSPTVRSLTAGAHEAALGVSPAPSPSSSWARRPPRPPREATRAAASGAARPR